MDNNSLLIVYFVGRAHGFFAFFCALFALCAIYNLVRGLILHRPKDSDSPASEMGRMHLKRVKKYVVLMALSFIPLNFIPSQQDMLKCVRLQQLKEKLSPYSYSYLDHRAQSLREKIKETLKSVEIDRGKTDGYSSSKVQPPSDREISLAQAYEQAVQAYEQSERLKERELIRLQNMILGESFDSEKEEKTAK